MWVHIMLARGFLRRHWIGWSTYVLLISATVLFSAIGLSIVQGVKRDIARSSEEISIDIVMRDTSAGEAATELAEQLSRRPDVLRIVPMDREAVWQSFQSDVGVRSEGMADVAALPHVVRLMLRDEFVTSRHVSETVRGLRTRLADGIETVIVPQVAVAEIEQRRNDCATISVLLISLAAAVVLSLSLGAARWLRSDATPECSRRLGRSAAWLGIGPVIVMVLGVVLGGIIAEICVVMLAPWLSLTYPWLIEPFVVRSATKAVLAMSSGMLCLQVLLALLPAPRVRGWQ